MQVNLNQLYIFHMVAKIKNMQEVAEKLHVSPPAVTMQIKRFEDWLGFKLFIRSRAELQLTEKAQEVYQLAEKLFSSIDNIESSLLALKQSAEKKIIIGIHRMPAEWLVPKILALLATEKASFEIEFVYGQHDELVEKLSKGQIHLALTPELDVISEYHKQFFTDYSIELVVKKHSSLGKKKKISVKELGNIPLVLQPHGTPFFEALNKYFTIHKIKPNNFIQNIISTVGKKLILEKDYAIFLPEFFLEEDLKRGILKAIQIVEPLPRMNLFFIYKDNSSELIKDFLNIVENFKIKN